MSKPNLRVIKNNLTIKQETFCNLIVSGEIGTQKEAYFRAYDVELDDKGNIPQWVEKEATVLLQHPKITQRINELIKVKENRLLASTTKTKEYVLKKLYELVETESNPQARIRSLELLGKSIAMFTDVQETKDTRTKDQVEQDIEAKLKELESLT